MKKKTAFRLILAAVLIVIGCILFGGTMTALNWNFRTLSTQKLETVRHGILEPFQNISIVTDTADVVFVPSKLDKTAVVCDEFENVTHSVFVKDGTLVVEVVDSRKWYDHIDFFFGTPKITLEIPGGVYGALEVTASTGDTQIPDSFQFASVAVSLSTGDVTCGASTTGDIQIQTSTGKVTLNGVTCDGDIAVNVSTGDVFLTDATCQNLTSTGSTGDMTLKNVIASGSFSIERSTGDIHFESCNAGEITVETDTGDVTGSFLTDKVLFTQTDTGRVRIPQTTTGGRCEITTTTGDIEITVN